MSAIARLLLKAIALTLVAASLAVASVAPATAADPGSVDGTIVTPAGATAPVTGLVSLWQWDSEAGAFSQYRATSLTGEPSGVHYAFTDVPEGDYYVRFGDAGDDYQDAYSGEGVTTAPTTLASTGVLHVSDAEGADADLSLVSRPAAQPVTGRVVNDDGAAIEAVTIEAWVQRTGGLRFAQETSTLVTGGFALQLRPGTYDLRFRSTDGLHQAFSMPAVVKKAPLALGDVQLEDAGPAEVRGRILGSNGKPLANALVRLYRLTGEPGSYDAAWTAAVRTGSTGTYTFDDVSTDNIYTVAASGWMHRFTALGGGRLLREAEGLDVLGDFEVGDLTLVAASGIRGTATYAGAAVPGVNAQLYQWMSDESPGYFELVDESATDPAGVFQFDALDAGAYTMYFDATDAAQGNSRWLAGSSLPSSPTGPGVIAVGTTAKANVKDVWLDPGLTARGTLRTGSSASGAEVTAYRYVAGKWTEFGRTTTTSTGSYTMDLPADSWFTFRFVKSGYVTEFLKSSSLPDRRRRRTPSARPR